MRSEFSLPNECMRRNVIIFGADMSSYVHVDNQKNDILTLLEGPIQGLDDTVLSVDTKYHINFAQPNKRFV